MKTLGRKRVWWVILAIFTPLMTFLGIGAWALGSPPGSSPDDDFHISSIWCGWGQSEKICEVNGKPDERLIPAYALHSRCYAYMPEVSAACLVKYPFVSDGKLLVSDHGNFQSNYPPVYYATMRLFVSDNIELSIIVMRLVNVAIFVAFVFALFILARTLAVRKVLFWMWAGSIIPLGIFLIASTNPSSWAITGVGSSWFALYCFFTATKFRHRFSAGVVFALAVVISAGARADAAVYTILTSLVVCILQLRIRRADFLKTILPAVMGLYALAFYFGSQQATVADSGLGVTTDVPWTLAQQLSLLAGNLVQFPFLIAGAFGHSNLGGPNMVIGNLGWLDTPMPMFTWVIALSVFTFLMIQGMRKAGWRKIIAFTVLWAAIVFFPLYVLQKSLVGVGALVQPRYILPLLIVALGVALLGQKKIKNSLSSGQAWFFIIGLTAANSLALHQNMRRYLTGTEVHSPNLNANPEWWWHLSIQPMTVWIIGSMAFSLALIGGFLLSGQRILKSEPAPAFIS